MLANLSEEQEAIRESAQRFAGERLTPGYMEREGVDRLDRARIKEMGALGFIAPDIPEDLGGSGASGVTTGIIMEALSYGDFNMTYVQLLGSLVGGIVARHAADHIAQEWVRKVTAGDAWAG